MNFRDCINQNQFILMEGALGERLKREYGIVFDELIAIAGLIYEEKGAFALNALWNEYLEIARKYGLPFIATTPTRRANRERIAKANCPETVIGDNVAFLKNIQRNCGIEMYVGGLMGCKGDAYTGEGALSEQEAFEFHKWTVEQFQKAGVDFLYAGIMPTLFEAAGLARAIDDTGLPYIISFTIQADGKLIDGTTITDAIRYIDRVTTNKPVCYMTNCVHPSIVCKALAQPFNQNETVKERFLGIQANTSPLSYAELDGAEELHCSEPEEFAEEMIKLQRVTDIKIWGGCCGTDHRHMEYLARKVKGIEIMKQIEVIPHEGIGPLKLGMSPEEIVRTLEQLHTEWSCREQLVITKDTEADGCYTLRYLDDASFFMVSYKDDKAVEISMNSLLREQAVITIYNMDVFKTPAEELVNDLKKLSSCTCDWEDEQLGTDYAFPEIGIRLWREEPFHPKLLSDKEYMEQMKMVIDEMYRYLYFEIIGVR